MSRVRLRRHDPRTHWVLLSVLMVLLLFALLVSGVVEGHVGEGARTLASHQEVGEVPPTFLSGGPIVDNTKVGNRRGILGRWQHIEYVIGFNLDRRMYDVLQCMPTVPGAIGAFRREALDAVGGVSADTLAEDTDLTMAICRAGWRVIYVPDACAWTEAPGTLRQLWCQRYRWCYGTMQSMWKHRGAVRESGPAGLLGRRGLPYLLAFQVVLPLLAPIIDIATLYSLVVTRSPTLLYVWLGFLTLQLLAAGSAFRLDGEGLRPLWSLPLQQIVYRQRCTSWSFSRWPPPCKGCVSHGRVSGGPVRWTPLRSPLVPDALRRTRRWLSYWESGRLHDLLSKPYWGRAGR